MKRGLTTRARPTVAETPSGTAASPSAGRGPS
jgi:hypothetical protein